MVYKSIWCILRVMGCFSVVILFLFCQHGSIIHECIVPLTGIRCIEGLFYEREYVCIPHILLITEEEVDKDSPYICFNEDRRFMKGKSSNSASCCLSNAREFYKYIL